MADFCRQCSIDLFNEDFGDLKGLSTPEDTANGLFACVICEGCGPNQVDHTGTCVSKNCLKKGHPPKPLSYRDQAAPDTVLDDPGDIIPY